jgi:ABC-type sugar transport system ATPase subunit
MISSDLPGIPSLIDRLLVLHEANFMETLTTVRTNQAEGL